MDTSKVNRVEVINHYVDPASDEYGRAYVFWKDSAKVQTMLQDDGRTLKIFINPG